jgi:hypothetical protein
VTVSPAGFTLPTVTPRPAELDTLGRTLVPTTETTLPAATTTTTAPAPAGVTTTAPPPPPSAITYFLDRLPVAGPTSSTDIGVVTSASLGLCLLDLPPGPHSVWAVVVDATATPLSVPIEGRTTFTSA